MSRPLLTIGIIFKNEIRCLERCLKSLQALKDTIPCELIMADTGSSDGSREIATHYADILFDFPWVDDFSAARNAIMEKALGEWYLTIDCDEYLDENISELTDFLNSSAVQSENLCMVIQRNYESFGIDARYSDLMAARLLRMSTGARYEGSIHESWTVSEEDLLNIRLLHNTVLHHDGYVELEMERGREKRERNLKLLRKKLTRSPKDLRTLLQYIESGKEASDYLEIILRACSEVEAKQRYWQYFGAPIFRYAVRAALEEELPEFRAWVMRAERWFPESPFTRIDVEYLAFIYSVKQGDYPDSICRGERFLKAMKDLNKDAQMKTELAYSTLLSGSLYWEQEVRIYLADIYIKEGNPKRAHELLSEIDATLLDEQQTKTMLLALGDLQRLSMIDTTKVLIKFLNGIKISKPSNEAAQKRIDIFFQISALAFLTENRMEESQENGFCRPAYTLFLPLGTECELGIAAMILQTEQTEELRQLLLNVKDMEKLPIEALSHALSHGVSFPLPEHSLKSEELEHLVIRMSQDKENFFSMFKYIFRKENSFSKNIQELTWLQMVSLTAINIYDWKSNSTDEGLMLVRIFARVMTEYLPRFYASELPCEDNLLLLPSFHRFGWYCVKAFDALDVDDFSEYVHALKAGLNMCPESKVIVEYLLKHTPQLQPHQQQVTKELFALAEQVRKLLSAYPPNDPAVAAIKASPVYQKVAGLIENNEC